jgi:hypothetical protein
MPSWKKVIISGSNAALNSLTVSNGITGSLFGTASFATSASFVPNTFIQNGNSFGTTATLGTNDNQSLQFETNGTTKMFISSSGNVGIGTTSPSQILDILRSSNSISSANFPSIRIQNTLATQGNGTTTFNFSSILLQSGNGVVNGVFSTSFAAGDWEPQVNLGAASNHPLIFRTNNVQRMRITSAGDVGIGTTNPTQRLSVVGKIDLNDGLNNVCAGSGSGINNTTGNQNSFVGIEAGFNNTTGSNNIAIGFQAGKVTFTGNPNQIGTNSLFIGTDTRPLSNGNTNQIVIGHNALGRGSNTVVLGNDSIVKTILKGDVGIGTVDPGYPLEVSGSVGGTSIYASNDIVAFSDQSVKENIRPIENVLERIGNSRGVLYDRVDSGNKNNIGFIAQELEIAFPELVVTNENGTKAVKYQNTVAVLFEAIKEQQKQINDILTLLNK